MKTEFVHISQVNAGDTIMLKGVETTVCKKDIGVDDGFMGKSLFGDSYKSGHTLVEKVFYPRYRMAENGQEMFYDK